MKKITLLLALFAISFSGFSQETEEEGPKQGWTRGGNISLLFNQSSFSNWAAGGQDNISGTLGINYDFNYVKEDITWDNKIIVSYGLNKLDDQDVQKTDDRLELNSLLVKKQKDFGITLGFLMQKLKWM
jgi:hypothetical protein